MNKNNKWFWAFIGVAVALVAAIIVAVVLGLSGQQQPPVEQPEIEEGPETGLYYYNSESGEFTLHLHSGNQFTLDDGVAKVGEYTVSESDITFVFKKESNGSATGKIDGDTIVLTYNGEEIRFLRKVNYTVTFNSNGGSELASVFALNSATIAKPQDPEKDGALFLGWYYDAELTTPFIFGSSIITGDTTLYAKWQEKTTTERVEYTISFEGADVADMYTSGGKLSGVPTPEKEGYTFGGWWISMTENAEKLSYKYNEDMVFDAHTTLFAVWVKAEGDKLTPPMVDVNEAGINWPSVNGAATYAVKITAPNGTVVFEDNVSATTKVFDFNVAGEYVIEVTAVASNPENNSETTVRYFSAKALPRVSVFSVVDSVLIFNGVEGAEQYFITVKCGNPDHNHTNLNNGASTVYNFYNCEMKEGGIEFTVTAKARGYADSVSKTFFYERKLDKVTGLTLDATTEKLSWTPVANTMFYLVEVSVGDETSVLYVNTASVSLKGFAAGELTVKVTPVTDGYISEATEYKFSKTTLAAPQNLVINGSVVTWDAVAGATKYTVKVGSKTFETTENTLDLTTVDLTFTIDEVVEVSVKTEGNGESLYSDVVAAKYQSFVGELIYKNGVVSWAPVIGDGYYEVKVNSASAITVNNANSYAVKFNKTGVNTVSVRYVGGSHTSDWVTIELNVSSITFDSRQGAGVEPLYFVKGDKVDLTATTTRPGYTFNAWYTTPNAANGNGAIYNDTFYASDDSIVLYAYWIANKYNVTYDVDDTVSGVENGAKVEVTFGQNFTLSVPTSDAGAFIGWFSGPGGSGYQLTDSEGNSLVKYSNVGDMSAYPFFEMGTLEYIANPDGTWSVTAGPAIKKVTTVIIPETYDGKTVTIVLENAFEGCSHLKSISIPNTVTVIGTGAFTSCYYLEAINVREIDGVQNPVYSSYDGALIRKDISATYLEFFPKGKSGEYTIPDTVDSIRNKAFQYSYNLTKLTISKNVTYVAEQAFYHCPELKEIVFEAGGTKALTIEKGAFVDTKVLSAITLPARLENVDISTFDSVERLATINVEDNGNKFGSIDGMLTNADKDTILYCPTVRSGDVTIPVGVTAIGDNAFAGRTGITSVSISNKVTSIGENAFQGAVNVTKVTFAGGRNTNLVIGANAFAGCTGVSEVAFETAARSVDAGTIEIGASAFQGCTSLTTLKVADTANIISIGASAFKGCAKLTALTIPATATSVGSSAFEGCTNLSKVAFAENGQEIEFGQSVFAGCEKLTSIHIPSTLVNFDGSIFDGCNAIAEITVDAGNPSYVAEDGILYNKGKTEVMYFPRAKVVDFSKLPATINKIGAAAFQANTTVTEIVIPANITEISDKAFEGCINLTSVSFAGNQVTKIGAYAFANCPDLTAITLPETITDIGGYAFYKTAIAEFTIPAATKTIGEFAFAYTKLTTVHIPAAVESIGDGAYSNCSTITAVTMEEGTAPLTIGTLGDVETTVGAFQHTDNLASVQLASRVVLVGTNAFTYHAKLTSITFGENSKLETVGPKAFYYNTCTSIELPESLKSIGYRAFAYDMNLTAITIPSTVTDIGEEAFWYCSKLMTVDFAKGGTADLYISDYAFKQCSKIQTVNLPARLTRIYEMVSVGTGINMPSFYTVFNSCNAITAINVEEGCAKYSSIDGVFYANDAEGNPATLVYCPPAKTGNITIPATVTLVCNGAFNKTKLTSVTFAEKENWDGLSTLVIGSSNSADTTDLSNYAVFGNSSSLASITLPAHLKAVNSLAFANLTKTGLTLTFNTSEDTNPVSFGNYAVYKTYATVLNLPKVASLGEYAISSNSKATAINFAVAGSTVNTISTGALYSNTAVTAITNIPASVTKIGENAFAYNSKATTIEFEPGSNVTTIGNGAFAGTKLTSFVLPESVETVGSGIFPSSLVSITLSSNLKSSVSVDGSSIFAGCSGLKDIIVPESNNYLVVVDGILYNQAMTVLMYCPATKDPTTVQIPDTINTIEAYAFEGFKGTTIALPEALVKIGDRAFTAAKLETLVIPAAVQEIGAYAFYSNAALSSLTFGVNSQLISIGDSAFRECDSLVRVEIPDTVTTIATQAFMNSDKLAYVDLPSSLTMIQARTFLNCGNLAEIYLYEGIEKIEYQAFSGCGSLESITIPASVTAIEEHWFYGTAFESCTSLKTVIFAEDSRLDYLGAKTFNGCTALESITLPKSLTVLSTAVNETSGMIEGIFNGCTNLKEVVLGNVQVIPEGFFAGYENLTTVVLPDTLVEIAANAFNGCKNLVNITIPAKIEVIGDSAFKGCESLTSVSLGANLAQIGNYAFEDCSALATVEFHKNCAISSLGKSPETESAIFRGTTSLKTIVLPDSVRTIGANLFENSGLESIVIPEKLTAISDYAFAGTNLKNIEIPETVRSIGNYAFANCALLETADIAFGVERIGSAAFMNCVKVNTVTIPASVNDIAGNPFVNCPELANLDFDSTNTDYVFENGVLFDADKYTLVYYLPTNTTEEYAIPETVRWFAEGAFYGSQLKSVTLPDKTTSIPAMLFMGSEKLETVIIPKSIKSIGKQAFEGCTALESLTIHETVDSIGEKAFYNSGLKSIAFAERNTQYTIGASAFEGCTSLETVQLTKGLVGFAPYMFANTGLVEFTIPDYITDLSMEGVFANNTKLTTVTIHDGVDAKLGLKFFMNCTALENVALGGITVLGDHVKCDNYSNALPGSVSTSSAFEGCTALKTIDLTNVTEINGRAFYGCTALESFVAPTASLKIIGDYAFANCTSLVSVDFYNTPVGSVSASDGSFYGPTWWAGPYSFANCTSLETFIFPKSSIRQIATGVFENCTSMQLVEITGHNGFDVGATPFKGLPSTAVISFPTQTYATAKSSWLKQYNTAGGNLQQVVNTDWLDTTDALVVFKNNAKLLSGVVFLSNGTSTIDILEYFSGTTAKWTTLSSKYLIKTSNSAQIDGTTGEFKSGTLQTDYVEHLEDGSVVIKNSGTKILVGGTIELANGMKIMPDRTLVLADGTEIPMTMTAAEIAALLNPEAPETTE